MSEYRSGKLYDREDDVPFIDSDDLEVGYQPSAVLISLYVTRIDVRLRMEVPLEYVDEFVDNIRLAKMKAEKLAKEQANNDDTP